VVEAGPSRPDGLDLLTLGETMGLVAFNDTGPLALGSLGRLTIGGAESNVAIGAARLGHRSGWIGRVGDDTVGRLVRTVLLAEGVDTSGVTTDPEVPTGLMLREHRTFDRFRVDYYRRGLAGSRLSAEQLPADQQARVVHTSGINPALSESAGNAARALMRRGREAGALVSFDVNFRSALWTAEQARPVLRSFLADTDLLFAGVDEAELILDRTAGQSTADDLARALADLGPREVVIKMGDQGALTLVDGIVTRLPARMVTCLDPVGAGDAFVAGYLSALMDGGDVDARLDRGVACGAFAVSVHGDWEGAPRRSELAMIGSGDNVLR
jgi:2-dehydro-3-deoxygluconokinase